MNTSLEPNAPLLQVLGQWYYYRNQQDCYNQYKQYLLHSLFGSNRNPLNELYTKAERYFERLFRIWHI